MSGVTELLFIELKVCSAGTPVLAGVDRTGADRAWHPIPQVWCTHPGELMPFPSQPPVSARLNTVAVELPVPVAPSTWMTLRHYLDAAANMAGSDSASPPATRPGGAHPRYAVDVRAVRDALRTAATRCLVPEPDDDGPPPAFVDPATSCRLQRDVADGPLYCATHLGSGPCPAVP